MANAIYKCMTKATTAEGVDLRYSHNWLVSRRAILKVMPDALICGDWKISYDQIDEAVLFSIWSIVPGYLLRVRVEETIYQFCLNWNPFWKKELPFPVSREKGQPHYSKFSIIIRLIVLGYVVFMIWEYISR